jgi:hypothetical protein
MVSVPENEFDLFPLEFLISPRQEHEARNDDRQESESGNDDLGSHAAFCVRQRCVNASRRRASTSGSKVREFTDLVNHSGRSLFTIVVHLRFADQDLTKHHL